MNHLAKGNRIRNRVRESGFQSEIVDSVIRYGRVFGWTVFVITALGFLASSSAGHASVFSSQNDEEATRTISSNFPTVRTQYDTDDVLEFYPPYLKFALEVGQQTDAATAKQLADKFNLLRKRHPEAAARFLKGLRFEMVQKLELTGMSPQQASSRSPEMRAWVKKYLKEWLRECDEHLFRAVTINRGIGKD